MSNYEYIISSLPPVSPDWKYGEGNSLDNWLEWIKSQLDAKDIQTLDRLLDGFREECLCKEFYEAALKDGNSFMRDFFAFDLNFRNAKARFVNKAFGRPSETDTIALEAGEFEEAAKMEEVLSGSELIARERSLDTIRWNKVTALTTFNYFDLDAILGIVAKMCMIERWRALDDETGREMFDRLTDEVRGTFGKLSYTAPANE